MAKRQIVKIFKKRRKKRKRNHFIKIIKPNSFQKRRLLMILFVETQFGYCPLVWIFHHIHNPYALNPTHWIQRSLRIVYRDYNSFFKDLLRKDNSVCIHNRNIQSLAVDLFKVKENLSNTINDNFPTRVLNYNFKVTDFFHKYRQ